MSDLELRVVNVRPGSIKQKEVGIMATFGLEIVVNGEIVAALADMKIQKSKKGGEFVASPSRKFTGQDGSPAYMNYIKIFPEDESGASSKNIIEQVRRECESGGSARKTYNKPQQSQQPRQSNSGGGW